MNCLNPKSYRRYSNGISLDNHKTPVGKRNQTRTTSNIETNTNLKCLPTIATNCQVQERNSTSDKKQRRTDPKLISIKEQYNYYQQHWFSASLERFKLEDRSREERLEITRHECMRQLYQMARSNMGKPNTKLINYSTSNNIQWWKNCKSKSSNKLNVQLPGSLCTMKDCTLTSLPCTQYCSTHIMHNTDQVLFEYCTAKFADSTQCSVPVIDVIHELPLCAEHARKRDNYSFYQDIKPRKKPIKTSTIVNCNNHVQKPQQKRNTNNSSTNSRKRRKIQHENLVESINATSFTNTVPDLIHLGIDSTNSSTDVTELDDMHMVDHVLELHDTGLDHVLETQASHLLEEADISTVLSTIQEDEFNDLFAVNRNGDYEPSKEETEELEKALAAVDNDVKSLEKLSQSQGLLESLLDEQVLADSLVQMPVDVFHNGYVNNSTPLSCGDNMVAQTVSFLLPIESHTHS